jgi:hypothetical protein
LFARASPHASLTLAFAVLSCTAIAAAAPPQRVVSAHGVRLTIPSAWNQLPSAGDGPVTDPRTLLVVGTAGVRVRITQCQIAAYYVPPKGAVVVVVGWRSLKESGAEHYKPGRAPLLKLVAVRRPSFECYRGRGAAADVVLQGTAYQVNVMVGDRAPQSRVAAALAVGRSFNIAR